MFFSGPSHCPPTSTMCCRVDRVVERPAADPVARLDHDDVHAVRVQVAGGGDPGEPGTDDDDVGLVVPLRGRTPRRASSAAATAAGSRRRRRRCRSSRWRRLMLGHAVFPRAGDEVGVHRSLEVVVLLRDAGTRGEPRTLGA